MNKEIIFRGRMTEFIPVNKRDKKYLKHMIRYMNRIRNFTLLNIKASKWEDEGFTYICLHYSILLSKKQVERYLKERPREEDRYVYVGPQTKPLLEVHYSRDKKFILLKSRGRLVKKLKDFDSALSEILKLPGKTINVNVSSFGSNPSEIAKKYKFDTVYGD